jgi:uncharacterized DUF497 family protein
MVIDWSRIAGFEWDEGNARKSAAKHGVTQAEAEQVFLGGACLVLPDPDHSSLEARFHALGLTDSGRHLHVTFTLRAGRTLIRVISARDMHRRERQFYEQAREKTPPAVHDRGRGARVVGAARLK